MSKTVATETVPGGLAKKGPAEGLSAGYWHRNHHYLYRCEGTTAKNARNRVVSDHNGFAHDFVLKGVQLDGTDSFDVNSSGAPASTTGS
jgi:hypothetical protein